ncbi:hypothetical protein NE236_03150 [Actinoallomurus purpureus]|uniref:hypothetical protein n=1 Tax=Actinoallomurus purpureus TaxID=478114 RepID=UPI002092F63F|nr:hypothetical protein [Actinoallomurus purpureus]MCO6003967.1 hypothetical protein [Actinoallomurus purpureus]
MEPVLPSAAEAIDHDPAEPAGHRDRHLITLPVDAGAWLGFYGLSHWTAPGDGLLPDGCGVSLIVEECLELTCAVFAENGERIDPEPMPDRPPGQGFRILLRGVGQAGTSPGTCPVHGTSLTFRFTYRDGSGVRDVILPLEYGEPVARALSGRHLFFQLRRHPVTSTGLRTEEQDRPTTAPPPGRWVRFCQIRSVAARAPSPWFTGAIAHWSAPDRADLGRLLGRFADDVTAHLTTLEDR